MKLTLDIENNVTKRDNKLHLDPFEKDNSLVMVGVLTDTGEEELVTFDHSEVSPTEDGHQIIQSYLDRATVLICHNVSHDLLWLWESGFTYDGTVFDTMLAEYVIQRGLKEPLSLEACADRHKLASRKKDTMKEYFKNGTMVSDIPHDMLSEYLSADLHATQELSDLLYKKLLLEDRGLMDTVLLTNSVAVCLTKIYRNGFTVDLEALEKVREEFQEEKDELLSDLDDQVRYLMGDFPINLNSPEQLSWVIYSRKPKNKAIWANMFADRMDNKEFRDLVEEHSDLLYKKKAVQCKTCYGSGKIRKTKKDGKPFAKETKCVECGGFGYDFITLYEGGEPVKAGLRFKAINSDWVSANGFTTNKTNLDTLEKIATSTNNAQKKLFLQRVKRLSALDTYLSSFVDGIYTHKKPDNMLHVRLLQHRTSTGRFSGADPNMQNMPRGGTFPVKKIFVSRWEGGKILEADFAQLEFRVAAFLGQDEVAMREIDTGFDVHSYTAKVISDAGQPMSRQEAKAHTFAPLYGASGFGRTKAEAAYYGQFSKKYSGIAKWHTKLAKEALNDRKIKTPSGREFAFPDVMRKGNGSVTHFTQIKNYPVQSFATADIVPLSLLHIEKELEGLRSCIVNTVHDSIVIDVNPNEEQAVIAIINSINKKLKNIIDNRWKIDFNVPLLLEAKIGNNWLDTKDVL